MAEQTAILNQTCLDFLDNLLGLLDAGGGPGYVEIRTGGIPATVDAAATGTLLVTIVLGATAFAAAVDTNPGASATMNATAGPINAVADGVIGYFRAFDFANSPVIQGNAATAGAAMTVTVASTTIGFPVDIVSWVVSLAEANY